MKRNCFTFLLLFSTFCVAGQDVREYIRKGDEAMKNLDYISAKIFYEEVVFVRCDLHTIKQLTTIWFADESIRADMNIVMKMCYTCLDNNATRLSDTASVNLLITYYKEGIGTNKNEAMAERWKLWMEEKRNPYLSVSGQNGRKPQTPKDKMQFFTGYSASLAAPVGLTVGGVGRTIGWYVRVRSNLSFQDYSAACDNVGNIIEGLDNGFAKRLDNEKVNTFMGTGGIMVKVAPSFYISAGAGYCSRTLLLKFEKIGDPVADPEGAFWAKCNSDTSFKGVALDLDGTFGIWNKLYGSIGFSVLNFKYLYANAGIGVFF